MKLFITKYALTAGILEREGKLSSEYNAYEIESAGEAEKYFGRYSSHLSWKADTFETHAEAVKRAEMMRGARIVSLRKQIEKLTKLTF